MKVFGVESHATPRRRQVVNYLKLLPHQLEAAEGSQVSSSFNAGTSRGGNGDAADTSAGGCHSRLQAVALSRTDPRAAHSLAIGSDLSRSCNADLALPSTAMFEYIVAPASIYNEAAFLRGAAHRYPDGSIVEPYDWHAELAGGLAGRPNGGRHGRGNQEGKVILDGASPVPPQLRITAHCIH